MKEMSWIQWTLTREARGMQEGHDGTTGDSYRCYPQDERGLR